MTLPEEQRAQLADWLLSGLPYYKAKQLVKQEFKVATSLAALSAFWEEYCGPALIRQRHQAVTTADQLAEEASKHPGQFDSATIEALKQKAFELSINPGAHPKDVKSLFMLVLKARDQDLDERQLALARDKFQRDTCELFLKWYADKRAKDIAGAKGVGTTEKVDRLGELIFGEDW